MLILNRNRGQRIVIGEEVLIEFLGLTENNQIRVGFTAPRKIQIYREEIYERIYKRAHPMTGNFLNEFLTEDAA